MTEANDFLFSGGVPSAAFPQIGAAVSGLIDTRPEVMQQRDFDSGEPMTWDDGKPRQQIKVVLATGLRDPEVDDDDGLRAIYVKAAMLKAIRAAVKKSGAKGLEVGGRLTVTYIADGEPPRKGANPPKIYSAEYQPPGDVATQAVLDTEPAEQSAFEAAAAAEVARQRAAAVPAQPAAPAIDLSQFTPEQIAAALRAAPNPS